MTENGMQRGGAELNQLRKKIVAFVCVLCTVFLLSQTVLGAVSNELEAHEVIILFDISTSMGWNDTGFLAPDALRQIVSTLPSHWHVGLVTFHAEVADIVPPGVGTRGEIHEILSETGYTDWTNSGVGFAQAMALFSERALSRTIIYMTDGEMAMMPTEAATAEAVVLAEAMVQEITVSGIRVHTIAVGQDFPNVHPDIMGLASATGGYLFQDVLSEALHDTARELVFDVLGVARNQVGAARMEDSGRGSFTVRLPATGIDSATVLITAESAVENIVVSGSGSSVEIETGQRFAIVKIVRPVDRVFQIDFTASGASSANLMLTWDLELMVEGVQFAPFQLWLADQSGENVLASTFFDGRFLPVSMPDMNVEMRVRIDHGYLYLDGQDFDGDKLGLRVQVDLEPFGINTPRPVRAFVEWPWEFYEVPLDDEAAEEVSDLPLTEEKQNVKMSFLVVGTFLILYLLLFRKPKREEPQTEMPAAEEPPVPVPVQEVQSTFEFSGKLDLYVTHAGDSRETAYLFQLRKGKRISLQDILRKCRVSDSFPGIEHVYFEADKQGALKVTNDSNCGVLLKSNLLARLESHMLDYGENVRISWEDGAQLTISPRFLYRIHA